MSENDQENQKSEKIEEPEVKKSENEEEKAKTKFTFKCTRCDECCVFHALFRHLSKTRWWN